MEIHALYYLDTKLILEAGRTYLIGRSPESDVPLPERTVSREHARLRMEEGVWRIRDLESTNGTRVNYHKVKEHALSDGDHISIGPFVCVYRHFPENTPDMREFDSLLSDTLQVERRIKELLDQSAGLSEREKIHGFKHFLNGWRQRMNTMANVDKLTGLFNRRFFDNQLAFEVERAARYGHAVSLVMIDIDHFKRINDSQGHQKGDEVLAAVGALIEANTRSSDIAARYGGEEMALILPETSRDQAAVAAEKLRRRIESESEARTKVKVTVSIGVAAVAPSVGANAGRARAEASAAGGATPGGGARGADRPTPARLVEAADAALYAAKERGRNRVVLG
ncbi:MAG: diguanylate cyclase [Spirochaetota bacterium]